MEKIINLHIQRLPEGYYLATSDNIQGLVAQGRTITETLEIARDVAKKLLEAQATGSHEIWYNEKTNKFTTIPNHPGDMPEGTLRAILNQADVNIEAFLNIK